jgi:hypothetical protein
MRDDMVPVMRRDDDVFTWAIDKGLAHAVAESRARIEKPEFTSTASIPMGCQL